VGVRGPGETQLEVDRREIGRRMAQLRAELELVRQQRRLHREQRKQEATDVVAIVGYTNSGKSTLLNALSGAGVLAEDKLFATLDPTTRRVALPGGREVLFTDTVGFIQKLPTELVAAFRATLEEISEADLILHVIDASHPNAVEQNETVMQTLADLEVADRPRLPALNKVDRLADLAQVPPVLVDLPDAVAISAVQGTGLEELLSRIEKMLAADLVHVRVQLPYTRGDLAALFHEKGTVVRQEHRAQGTVVEGFLPRRWLESFRPYL